VSDALLLSGRRAGILEKRACSFGTSIVGDGTFMHHLTGIFPSRRNTAWIA
jgi:hypothetical protein